MRPATRTHVPAALAIVIALLTWGTASSGKAEETGPRASAYTQAYTLKGADDCLKCHDGADIVSIFHTPHAAMDDPRTPFAILQCEGCHGPGRAHSARIRRDEQRPPILDFGSDEPFPVDVQNAVCLDCHKGQVAAWSSGPHDVSGVACADCHSLHPTRDAMAVRDQQAQKCYGCHKLERSQFQRAYTHPVRFGVIACSACHDLHQSLVPAMLHRPTLNETCYDCHAEKRGPFLWEHLPVTEDCSLCHVPHGSNHAGLLSKPRPLLCQDCHSRAGHPSVAYTGAGLPTNRASGFLLAGSCTNCHSQVHGSNHPSGAELMR